MTDTNPTDGEIADSLKEYCQELSMEKLQLAVQLKLARNRIEEFQYELEVLKASK
jgi:hypothetical protein